jgi:hypothetical protein
MFSAFSRLQWVGSCGRGETGTAGGEMLATYGAVGSPRAVTLIRARTATTNPDEYREGCLPSTPRHPLARIGRTVEIDGEWAGSGRWGQRKMKGSRINIPTKNLSTGWLSSIQVSLEYSESLLTRDATTPTPHRLTQKWQAEMQEPVQIRLTTTSSAV